MPILGPGAFCLIPLTYVIGLKNDAKTLHLTLKGYLKLC